MLHEAGKHGEMIVFDGFGLLMLARAGVGDYTSTQNISLDQEYAVTLCSSIKQDLNSC